MATTRGAKPSKLATDVNSLQSFAQGTETSVSRGLPIPGTLFSTTTPDVVHTPIAPFLAKNKIAADKKRGYTILPDGSIGDIHE